MSEPTLDVLGPSAWGELSPQAAQANILNLMQLVTGLQPGAPGTQQAIPGTSTWTALTIPPGTRYFTLFVPAGCVCAGGLVDAAHSREGFPPGRHTIRAFAAAYGLVASGGIPIVTPIL